jgi:hypothetical protein
MTEQEENELIAEKLLRWERIDSVTWRNPDGSFNGEPLPAFTTWADAGLILEALHARHVEVNMWTKLGRWNVLLTPPDRPSIGAGNEAGCLEAIIRAAALEYIRTAREVGAEQ